MAHYRIYSLYQSGHVVAPAQVVECDNDEEIVTKARSMLDGLDLEIWDGARRVTVLISNHYGQEAPSSAPGA